MDNLIKLIIAVFILGILYAVVDSLYKKGSKHKAKYYYTAKSHIMTERETKFFKHLNDIFGSKFYVIPQVHLSSLLNHKLKGQNWDSAFKHINGKSVDFVLLSKESTKPICAIELDDSSHDRLSRIERDGEVERIFAIAQIPLARFRHIEKLSNKEIVDTISEAIKAVK